MPAKKEFTPEFKEQAVRFVLESIEPDESRRRACERLAPKLSMNPITLYAWVKASAPGPARPAPSPGSVEELRAQVAALRKENRELARANEILKAASAFFGAELDRQSKR
jgi:transposase